MIWQQIYNPLGNILLSALLASVPVVVMLAALAFFHVKAHVAALLSLGSALVRAVFGFGMPGTMAMDATLFGAINGPDLVFGAARVAVIPSRTEAFGMTTVEDPL